LQELKRHLLSIHLPDCLYCPHPRCKWRGHRKDDLKLHLTTHPNRLKCASKLSPEQYSIYDVDLILSWILDDNEPVEKVARFALNFVFERGLELKRVEEWANLWRSSIEEKGARRRIHQRREGRIKARPLPLPGHK
jgi:hypothetical protein